jgi:hypothetical protein
VEYDSAHPDNVITGNILPKHSPLLKKRSSHDRPFMRSQSSVLEKVPENDENLENSQIKTSVPTKMPSMMGLDSAIPVRKDSSIGSLTMVPKSPVYLNVDNSMNMGVNRSLKRTKSTVIETSILDKTVDDDGQKKINQYVLIKEIGRGGFGKVKLAVNQESKEQFAIKIANKSKLKRKLLNKSKSAFTQLQTEIAIMKKLVKRMLNNLFNRIIQRLSNWLRSLMIIILTSFIWSWNMSKREQSSRKPIGRPKMKSQESLTITQTLIEPELLLKKELENISGIYF